MWCIVGSSIDGNSPLEKNSRSDWSMTLLKPLPPPTPKEYWVALPCTATSTNCQVEEWPERVTIRPNLHIHLMHGHMKDIIYTLTKGTFPHSRRKQCGMFVLWEILVAGHLRKKMCRRGAERKRRRLSVNYAWVATGMELVACSQIIEKVDTSK